MLTFSKNYDLFQFRIHSILYRGSIGYEPILQFLKKETEFFFAVYTLVAVTV